MCRRYQQISEVGKCAEKAACGLAALVGELVGVPSRFAESALSVSHRFNDRNQLPIAISVGPRDKLLTVAAPMTTTIGVAGHPVHIRCSKRYR